MIKLTVTVFVCVFGYLNLFGQFTNNDQNRPILICDKDLLTIDGLNGSGELKHEIDVFSFMVDTFPENHCAWFKFKVKTAGELSFILNPLNESDDLDFIVFQENANSIIDPLRCMAAGPIVGDEDSLAYQCTGITGLLPTQGYDNLGQGCEKRINFLNSLPLLAGNIYYIFVNNYKSNGGFSIELSGDFDLENLCQTTNVLSSSQFTINGSAPNPAHDHLALNYTTAEEIDCDVQITNNLGLVVRTQKLKLEVGNQMSVQMDVSVLKPGFYNLLIRSKEITRTLPFIKL